MIIAEIEKTIKRSEPNNQRRDERQSSLNPITKAIAPAANADAPRINNLGELTGSVTEPQITKIDVKAAPNEIKRARLFSLLKFNMLLILLKKRPKPGSSEEGPGFGFRSLKDRRLLSVYLLLDLDY